MTDKRVPSSQARPTISYEPGIRGLFMGRVRRWRYRVRNWRRDWLRFLAKPIGLFGLGIIATFALLSIAHPILMSTVWDKNTYDPILGHDASVGPHPVSFSTRHLLGTDYRGRDVFSMLAFAARTSFGVGILAALVGTTVATAVGVITAYYGGIPDLLLMILSDVFLLLPAPVVLLTVGLIFDMTWLQVGLIYGIFAGLGSLALTMKSHVLTIKTKQYVQAGWVSGGGGWRIIRTHILPNLTSLIIINMMFIVTGSVMIEALTAYISDSANRFSWGTMIWQIQDSFRGAAEGLQWHVIIPPALAIMLFCGSFYLVGRALDEAVNPKLRSD